MEASKIVPSLAEAERVASFVLAGELPQLAAKLAAGAATADGLREFLALTIAVVGATETPYQASGKPNPSPWEALEESARTFMDHFVLKVFAGDDPDVDLAVTRHRMRKLTARAGTLCLLETDRDQRHRWSGGGVAGRRAAANRGRGQRSTAGQVIGLLAVSEFLLALLPSNQVAAFCVRLAATSAAR